MCRCRLVVDAELHTHLARLCVIHSWHDGRGYGFNIHAGNGRADHVVGSVDATSPAAAAGLRDGDRVVEVNGVNVDQLDDDELAAMIKSDLNTVRLLVLDHDADDYFQQRHITVTSDMEHCVERITSPETKPEGLLSQFRLTYRLWLIFFPKTQLLPKERAQCVLTHVHKRVCAAIVYAEITQYIACRI